MLWTDTCASCLRVYAAIKAQQIRGRDLTRVWLQGENLRLPLHWLLCFLQKRKGKKAFFVLILFVYNTLINGADLSEPYRLPCVMTSSGLSTMNELFKHAQNEWTQENNILKLTKQSYRDLNQTWRDAVQAKPLIPLFRKTFLKYYRNIKLLALCLSYHKRPNC